MIRPEPEPDLLECSVDLFRTCCTSAVVDLKLGFVRL